MAGLLVPQRRVYQFQIYLPTPEGELLWMLLIYTFSITVEGSFLRSDNTIRTVIEERKAEETWEAPVQMKSRAKGERSRK